MSFSSFSTSASAPAPTHSIATQRSSASTSENTAKRQRLAPPHLKPLHDEWERNPGKMPPLPVRKALQADVEKLSGVPYPMTNVSSFFNGRKSKLRGQDRDPRFSSLTKEAIEYLDQLLKTSNNPTPELIALFSQLIARAYPGCTSNDVATYIGHAQAEQQRFPTPTSISSPVSGPSSPEMKFKPATPITSTSETVQSPPMHATPVVSPPPYISRKYTPSPPPAPSNGHNTGEAVSSFKVSPGVRSPIKAEDTSFLLNPLQSADIITDTRHRPLLIDMLCDGVQEGLDKLTPPTTPSSAAGLDSVFSRIEKLSHSLSRGKS